MEKIDLAFELYFVTALTNHEFGNGITPQGKIWAVLITANKIDIVNTKTDNIFSFCEYFLTVVLYFS